MKVEQIMNRDPKVCHGDDSLNHAAQIMWDNSCGGVPVVDQETRPVGFLTDRDICMAAYTQGKLLEAMRVEGAMARKVISCMAYDDINAAALVMSHNGVRRLPVTDENGKLVGLLSLDDLAHEAARTLRGGGTNQELRNLVARVFVSINRGRARVHRPSEPPSRN
jgi:CBS domain-containing protein